MIGAKNKKIEKDRITYVDKSTPVRYVGKQGERGEAKLSTRQTRLETR